MTLMILRMVPDMLDNKEHTVQDDIPYVAYALVVNGKFKRFYKTLRTAKGAATRQSRRYPFGSKPEINIIACQITEIEDMSYEGCCQ